MPAPHFLRFALIASCLWIVAGCGTATYQPSRVASFELEPQQEIDDVDIEKAFAARPQLPSNPSVTYYVFDDEYADGVAKMLAAVRQVKTTYRVPALLVSGKRRFDAGTPAPYGYAPPSKPLSMKKLRLLAARAHTDLLVVVDYGYRVEVSPNAYALLSVAIFPIFFAPLRDIRVESYIDSYVIDTRNGYLYGQVQTAREQTEDDVDVWSSVQKRMIDDQFAELMGKTGRLLSKLLDEERSNSLPALRPKVSKTPPRKHAAKEAGREAGVHQSR